MHSIVHFGCILNAELCPIPLVLAGLDGCAEWWGEAEDFGNALCGSVVLSELGHVV